MKIKIRTFNFKLIVMGIAVQMGCTQGLPFSIAIVVLLLLE
jgi:hypothetical protein